MTSDCAASFNAISTPSGWWRSSAIERLPRLHVKYRALMPLTATPTQRPRSPMPGRSTFTTSAPWSAMSAAAYGPVSAIEKSRTRTPRSGPVRSVTGSAEGAGIAERRDLGVVVAQHVTQHRVGVLAQLRRLGGHRQLFTLDVQREQEHVGAGLIGELPAEPVLELRVVAHR